MTSVDNIRGILQNGNTSPSKPKNMDNNNTSDSVVVQDNSNSGISDNTLTLSDPLQSSYVAASTSNDIFTKFESLMNSSEPQQQSTSVKRNKELVLDGYELAKLLLKRPEVTEWLLLQINENKATKKEFLTRA